MMSKRAQAGVEGMVMLAIVFFIFLGAYALSVAQQRSVLVSGKEMKEQEECLLLANAIVNIYQLNEKAQMIITLKHNFTLIPAEQRIESKLAVCTLPIGSFSSSGSPITSAFTLLPGEVKIMKKEWVALSNE